MIGWHQSGALNPAQVQHLWLNIQPRLAARSELFAMMTNKSHHIVNIIYNLFGTFGPAQGYGTCGLVSGVWLAGSFVLKSKRQAPLQQNDWKFKPKHPPVRKNRPMVRPDANITETP